MKRKIYLIDERWGGRGPGWDFVNRDTLQPDKRGICPKVSWPDGLFAVTRGPWTIPEFTESPRFIIDSKLGHPIRDVQLKDGFIFISGKFKRLIEEVAPSACEFRPCVTEYRNSKPGPEIWLCSVTKVFRQSINLSESKLSFRKTGGYSIYSGDYLSFKNSIVGGSHLFRVAETAVDIFCDDYFKIECKKNNISGIVFKEIGENTVENLK